MTNVRARQQIARAPVAVEVGGEDAVSCGEGVEERDRQIRAYRRTETPDLVDAESERQGHQRARGKNMRAIVAGRAVRAIHVVIEGRAGFKFEAVLAAGGGGPRERV